MRGTVLAAGFIGNRGVGLFMQVNPNQLRIREGFLAAFRELQAFRIGGTPVSPSNTLVRLFGSVNGAITAIGPSTLDEGSVVAAADNVDRTAYPRYPEIGLSDFYLRNFPQFNVVAVGRNDGRSYYDSLQVSLKRRSRSLNLSASYTLSKTINNFSGDGADLTRPVDSFDLRSSRGLSDGDRKHVFNMALVYTLPLGRSHRLVAGWPRWLTSALGGWDVGMLSIWESEAVFSVRSGRRTAGDNSETFANYVGDRRIGSITRRGDGVFWFSSEEIDRFSFPVAGEIGTSGRNSFRGPRHFNTDIALVKRFRFGEQSALVFRSEFYNVFNNVNFANPSASLLSPASLGRINSSASGGPGLPVGGTSGGPRILQIALRYEF